MSIAWTRTRFSPIAIDFGADSLKLLQVLPDTSSGGASGGPPLMVAAAAVAVPDEARGDGAARRAFFADALRQALKTQTFHGKHAVCSTPGYQTLIQN